VEVVAAAADVSLRVATADEIVVVAAVVVDNDGKQSLS
jgi:hypothetical protein